LSNTDAGKGLPVSIEATVTYLQQNQGLLFVQERNAGIFIIDPPNTSLITGDRVLIKGTTTPAYHTDVICSEIAVLRHGQTPKPAPATFDQLIQDRFDSVLVRVRGIVRSADLDAPSAGQSPRTTLRVLMDGGYVDALVDNSDKEMLSKLLDSEVEITAVAGGKFDGKGQLTGIALHVSSLANIRILKRATVSPWALPVTPMDQVLSVYHANDLTRRVRVSGIATYFDPGSALVLENGQKSIWIQTNSRSPIRIGDWAEATGFPAVRDGFLMLYGSTIQDAGLPAPIRPERTTWPELASSRHIFDLVSIEGQVVMEAREDSQDEFVLVSEGHMFSAVYPQGPAPATPSPMWKVPIGARIRVTGICSMVSSDQYGRDVPFNILLRSEDDLAVLAQPSWFTARHLETLLLVLLLAMLAGGARAWYIDRTSRARVAALAYVEQRRGRILEDINQCRPLPEILERITELVSFSLKGAPCWGKVGDGPTVGNCPAQLNASGLRIVEHAIPARSGAALGSIFAAFHARTTPGANEEKALAQAAELATLAIETARLYADLVHRSEFDMLTDIQNRFSFGKHLDFLLNEARRTDAIFGIIYIDLDEFKQVNDKMGHQVGDQYMQQAAMRMKRQLRPEDILARLGGDEFAVLLPVIQGRPNVEEIASRLKRCFHDPFAIEGFSLQGSASFGTALYPDDATTGDELLKTADAAMYAAKNAKRVALTVPKARLDAELTVSARP
jgi:diguanylate cyclase (GGDEF)-like protein